MAREIVICDEDPMGAEQIRTVVAEFESTFGRNADILIYTDGERVETDCFEGKIKPDIMFMDIEPDNMKGIGIVKKINVMLPECHVIYVSENLRHDSDIYKTKHLYFVIRDELRDKMHEIYGKIQRLNNAVSKAVRIELKKKQYITINKNDILWLERKERVTYVHTKSEIYESPTPLNEFENVLEDLCFVRCHNSFIISAYYIKKYKREDILMQDGMHIPISRKYQQIVRKKITNEL